MNTNGQAKHFNILRACVLIVTLDDAVIIYINGKKWRTALSPLGGFVKLKDLFLKRMVIIDSWDAVYIPELESHPELQSSLLNLYPAHGIPEYKGAESHGLSGGLVSESSMPKKRDPDKLHVKWFAWFTDDRKELVYVGDRDEVGEIIGTKAYRPCWEHTRNIAIERGGTKCTEFSEERFPTKESIEKKYKLSDSYS